MWDFKKSKKAELRTEQKDTKCRRRKPPRYYRIRAELFWFFLCMVSVYGIRHWACYHASESINETGKEWNPSEQKLQDPVKSTLENTGECYLCGDNTKSLMGMFRRYDDLGIICLNEWYVLDMKIRNHDDAGNLTGPQGGMNITSTSTGKESCFFRCEPNSDRGISDVTVSYGEDSFFDAARVQGILCQDCLDKAAGVMDVSSDEKAKPRDLCLVDFQTLELYSLQGDYSAYYIRDYYVQVDAGSEDHLRIEAIYAPVLENGKKSGE